MTADTTGRLAASYLKSFLPKPAYYVVIVAPGPAEKVQVLTNIPLDIVPAFLRETADSSAERTGIENAMPATETELRRRLKQLREAHGRATPGIWDCRQVQLREDRSAYAEVAVDGKSIFDTMNADEHLIERDEDGACVWYDTVGGRNADFVCIAHNDMPWLLQMVDDLMRVDAEQVAAIAAMGDTIKSLTERLEAQGVVKP